MSERDAAHSLRANALADKIVATAERGLAPFEMSIAHYPDEFKAIMWDAIAEIAVRRAAAARQGG